MIGSVYFWPEHKDLANEVKYFWGYFHLKAFKVAIFIIVFVSTIFSFCKRIYSMVSHIFSLNHAVRVGILFGGKRHIIPVEREYFGIQLASQSLEN